MFVISFLKIYTVLPLYQFERVRAIELDKKAMNSISFYSVNNMQNISGKEIRSEVIGSD